MLGRLQDEMRLALPIRHHDRLATQRRQLPVGVLQRRGAARRRLAGRLRCDRHEAFHQQRRARRAAVFERTHHQARVHRGKRRRARCRAGRGIRGLQRSVGALRHHRELIAAGAIEERCRIGHVAVQPSPAARLARRTDTANTAQQHVVDAAHVAGAEHRISGVAGEQQLTIRRDAAAHRVVALGIDACAIDRNRESDRHRGRCHARAGHHDCRRIGARHILQRRLEHRTGRQRHALTIGGGAAHGQRARQRRAGGDQRCHQWPQEPAGGDARAHKRGMDHGVLVHCTARPFRWHSAPPFRTHRAARCSICPISGTRWPWCR